MRSSKPHTYRIAHSGSDGRIPREIEFEAVDAAAALFEARLLAPLERPVLIKEDGRELATVQMALEGFWSVSQNANRREARDATSQSAAPAAHPLQVAAAIPGDD